MLLRSVDAQLPGTTVVGDMVTGKTFIGPASAIDLGHVLTGGMNTTI